MDGKNGAKEATSEVAAVATKLAAPEPFEHDTFTGAPDSPSTVRDTKRYLEDFDRLQKSAPSDRALFDQMTALYPDWDSGPVGVDVWIPGGITQVKGLIRVFPRA